jgi:hypothetical protein
METLKKFESFSERNEINNSKTKIDQDLAKSVKITYNTPPTTITKYEVGENDLDGAKLQFDDNGSVALSADYSGTIQLSRSMRVIENFDSIDEFYVKYGDKEDPTSLLKALINFYVKDKKNCNVTY